MTTEDRLRRYTGNKTQRQQEGETIELASPGTPDTRTHLGQLGYATSGTLASILTIS